MEVKNIYQALAAINRELRAVGKNQQNAHFKYNFRGIDDVLNTLHPLFAKHGVVISCTFRAPSITERTVAGSNGRERIERMCQVACQYTLTAEDGSSVNTEGIGLGADDSDKGLNKAQVQAFKYMLLTLFTIPTDDMDEADQDGGAVESAPSTYQADANQKKLLCSYAKACGITKPEQWKILSDKCMDVAMDDLKATVEGVAKTMVQV